MTSNPIFAVTNQLIRQPTFLWYAGASTLSVGMATSLLYFPIEAAPWYLAVASIALFALALLYPESAQYTETGRVFWQGVVAVTSAFLALSPFVAQNFTDYWYMPLASIALFTVALVVSGSEEGSANTPIADTPITPEHRVVVTQFGRERAANDLVSKVAA